MPLYLVTDTEAPAGEGRVMHEAKSKETAISEVIGDRYRAVLISDPMSALHYARKGVEMLDDIRPEPEPDEPPVGDDDGGTKDADPLQSDEVTPPDQDDNPTENAEGGEDGE